MAFFSRIRFLPFLIFVAVLFLGFRINHFVSLLSGAIEESPFMQLADAANPEDDEEKSTEDETGNKAEDKTDITAGDGAQENQDPAKKDMAAVEAEEEAEVDGVDETKLRPKLYEVEKDDFSIVNEEIIEELMLHKKQLVEKRTELDEREVMLQVAEKRVDEKVKELQLLKNQIEELLNTLENDQQEQIRSLVKIYESMKPKDAARIFDTLEMDVLIEVADLMKEARLGAVLAKMNENKAKLLTRLIAERKKFG